MDFVGRGLGSSLAPGRRCPDFWARRSVQGFSVKGNYESLSRSYGGEVCSCATTFSSEWRPACVRNAECSIFRWRFAAVERPSAEITAKGLRRKKEPLWRPLEEIEATKRRVFGKTLDCPRSEESLKTKCIRGQSWRLAEDGAAFNISPSRVGEQTAAAAFTAL